MEPTVSSRVEDQSLRGSIPLFRIGGVRIRLDYSWFLIFVLVFVSLSFGYFPGLAPEASVLSHLLAGLVATLMFFGSVVAHELAHSWMAIRAGIPVEEIRLFLFGGVSRMSQEPTSPRVELRVAIVGPLMSFCLALVFAGASSMSRGLPEIVPRILSYLAWINLALGVFNLLPGFPLDGGRVLRALVWWRTGSLRKGTKVASDAGSAFAIALMVLGGLQILAGALVGGLWMILLGVFLRSLAKQGYASLLLRNALAGVSVGDVMVRKPELVTVPAGMTLQDLVDDYFLGRGFRGFPVVEGGRALGVIASDDVRRVDRASWPERTVESAMAPLDDRLRISPDDSLLQAIERLSRTDSRRLLVMEDGELLGLVTSGNISRFVELRSLLQGK